MFESAFASVRPRRRGTIVLSTTLHAALTSALVFPPMLRMPELQEEPPDKVPELVQFVDKAPKEPDAPKSEPAPPQHVPAGGGTNVRVVTPPTEIPKDLPRILGKDEEDKTREVIGTRAQEPDVVDNEGPVRIAPPGPATDEPIQADAPGVTPPVALSTPGPAYPPPMLIAHMEGLVLLEAVIDTEGNVTNVRVLRSANPLFDRAATEAVLKWRYSAALVGGRKVSVYLTVTVNFRINR